MHTEEDFQFCASRLKALADPDRLRIVDNLLQGRKSVSALVDELEMAMDKVSHHLGVLRAANLVQTQKQGKYVIYSLHPDVASADLKTKGVKTIDLGCCQLDLVQPTLPQKTTRKKIRSNQ